MIEHETTGWMDRISLLLGRISLLMIAAIVAVMFYEVVLRYVFEAPTLWANELSLWLAGGVFLVSGLYTMQQRGHIRIFLLYDVVPRWMQRIFDILSTLLTCTFAAAIVFGGFNEARDKLLRWETYGTAFDPPIPATLKPLILLIVVLIALQGISNLICDWNRKKEVHAPVADLDGEPGPIPAASHEDPRHG